MPGEAGEEWEGDAGAPRGLNLFLAGKSKVEDEFLKAQSPLSVPSNPLYSRIHYQGGKPPSEFQQGYRIYV